MPSAAFNTFQPGTMPPKGDPASSSSSTHLTVPVLAYCHHRTAAAAAAP
jgi:hypothetical protein